MAADVAQCEHSNIKCYASAFSNILISKSHTNSTNKDFWQFVVRYKSYAINILKYWSLTGWTLSCQEHNDSKIKHDSQRLFFKTYSNLLTN